MVYFGQIVIGPPGSGKTTYCHGMKMFLESIGRKCEIINLDFANDHVPYEASVDVRDLVSLERVMEEINLGPNGGLIYCMEYLLENYEWLEERIRNLESRYLVIDCPGQIELYTHYQCVQKILKRLQNAGSTEHSTNGTGLDCRLCSVHLVDSYHCSVPATFISALLLVASTMMRLGLPHVNVLSKVDLLQHYGTLPFKLDFFTEMGSILPLARYIDAAPFQDQHRSGPVAREESDPGDDMEEPGDVDAMPSRFRRMTEGLCEVLDDFGLISFVAMNIADGETVARVLSAVDKANGYSFAAAEAREVVQRSLGKVSAGTAESVNQLFRIAVADDTLESTYMRSLEIQERYCGASTGFSVKENEAVDIHSTS